MRIPSLTVKGLRRRLPSRHDSYMVLLGGLVVLATVGVISFIKSIQTPLRPEADTLSTTWLSPTVKRWQDPVIEMSKKYDIDPNLIAIIITLESGG